MAVVVVVLATAAGAAAGCSDGAAAGLDLSSSGTVWPTLTTSLRPLRSTSMFMGLTLVTVAPATLLLAGTTMLNSAREPEKKASDFSPSTAMPVSAT